ncbi:MAG TPA: regulatory iron-sulfur-containing complex subunit RicT [Gemmatimonadaceae bacterium]|nr:regulatory iron-sulfur-containing complex subunit RicT [Gemmatimonadaceae bacterium]
MAHLVEVAFRGNRKEFFLWDYPDPPALKSAIIVDADRGEDLGYVHSLGELAQVRNGGCAHGCGTSAPTRKALRLATPKDTTTANDLVKQNEEARRKAMERVRANGLAMKLSDAEWQWDRKKLTFYFTAEKRVDFRNLVRDLASLFRTRIELKQIGVRDEAKRLDGIGRCGRQFCSASWLPELRPVNLGVAKDQRLSLNPAQISGACGRLMCCLRYEHDFYVQSRKRFPKEGKIVITPRGEEKVLAIDIFRERVTLRNHEGESRLLALADYDREIAAAGGRLPSAEAAAIEEDVAEVAFEISPELMYTTEHEIPAVRDTIVSDPRSQEPVATENGDNPAAEATRAGDRDDAGARRRRGRRGGRRGRGTEPGER